MNSIKKVILLFHVEQQKKNRIEAICKLQGIRLLEVDRKRYEESLGALAGIEGIPKMGKVYEGAEFPMEMMVFSGIDSEGLDAFLKAYREAGITPIGLKAVITPHNIFWSAAQLYGELLKEHIHFGQKKTGDEGK